MKHQFIMYFCAANSTNTYFHNKPLDTSALKYRCTSTKRATHVNVYIANSIVFYLTKNDNCSCLPRPSHAGVTAPRDKTQGLALTHSTCRGALRTSCVLQAADRRSSPMQNTPFSRQEEKREMAEHLTSAHHLFLS